MLVNVYILRQTGLVGERDISNFLSRLAQLTTVTWKTIHVPDVIVRHGSKPYTVIRSIAHYDISLAIKTLEARCNDPFKQANHKKVWKAKIRQFKEVEACLRLSETMIKV